MVFERGVAAYGRLVLHPINPGRTSRRPAFGHPCEVRTFFGGGVVRPSKTGAASSRPQVASEPPARKRSLLENWRSALALRVDTEHEVALGRVLVMLALLGAVLVYGGALASGFRFVLATAILALGYAVVLLLHVLHDPDPSARRRYLSLIGDQLILWMLLHFLGPYGVWALPVQVIVAIDAGLRYGRLASLVASATAAAGLALVHFTHGDEWTATAIFQAALATLLLAPAYVAVQAARLQELSEAYRARARRAQRQANYDQLTGLANRAHFRKVLDRAIESARGGNESESFAVLYCDLDGFKAVNDTHGHHIGDQLLKAVGKAIESCVRGTDAVARLGGDEFAVYLKGVRDTEIAKRIGTAIVARVGAINRIDGRPIVVSCSVGITMVSAPIAENEHLDRVLARADEAMYQAKRAGKNQFYLQWAV